MLMLAGCGAEDRRNALQVIEFRPGRTIDAMVPEDLRQGLSARLGRENEPGVAVISRPHTVRLELGRQAVEIHPGGYNSATYLQMGYRPSPARLEQVDYTRVGELSTDTGSRLMSAIEVRRLALDLCARAEEGLGAAAEPHPVGSLAEGAAKKLLANEQGSADICVVEGMAQTFVVRLSASAPSVSAGQEDDARFRLVISLGQSID